MGRGTSVTVSRRLFLQAAAASVAAARAPALDPGSLARFADPLPIPPVARSAGQQTVTGFKAPAPLYRLAMREFQSKLHRDLPPTRLWGFNGCFPGPTLEARGEEALAVEWINQLPERHFLPIDHTLHGAEASLPAVRGVVHVHGAKAPPESDGYPEEWYVPGKSAVCHYPNRQDAATLWYHDHAMGINRLNIYAGLFGLYLVRDAAEDALHLPSGAYEVPLVLCDRLLRRDGQLDYPDSGKPGAPWVPEVFGNAMLVNGKISPYLAIEPCQYRFRFLNGANARFFHLSLSNGLEFQQIGTDQGLLPAPVALRDFVLAPGERLDVVVDFKDCAGENIVLANDAFQMMQFRVARGKSSGAGSLPARLRPVPRLAESDAVRERFLTIDEYQNKAGESVRMLLNRSHWAMPVTEKPVLGSTEIWSILNSTDDSHPIHLHLVRMQILDRRPYNALLHHMTGQLRYLGPPQPPESYEAGWKDTVRAHSMMVTRFIARFDGYPGRYVWHCHVLEHEDNEMMRPFEVVAP